MERPKVLVIVLGGTITMASNSTGIVPKIGGDELVANVPALANVAEITVETAELKPGASLTFKDIEAVSQRIRNAGRDFEGVVVVQGTDTIDEVSFVLDLLEEAPPRVVVTGALRGATASGADGPASLLAAIIAASSKELGKQGVLVVLNDEIHAASRVEKMHKSLPSAFGSPNGGPLGSLVENRVQLLNRIASPPGRRFSSARTRPVAVIRLGFDDDDRLLRAVPSLGYEGVVIEGMGAGHVAGQMVAAVAEVLARMPVILASRVPGGRIYSNTYALPGSEIDLLARGLIPAGNLSPHKARLLLMLCLGNGLPPAEIKATFEAWAG